MDQAVTDARSSELRVIEGRGTDERVWRTCPEMEGMRPVDVAAWARRYRRIWIVSPHPDDEVLALGATMARLSRMRADLRIVSVTAGSASHPGSARWPASRLALVRPAELRRAVEVLDIDASLVELDIPDGDVAGHVDALIGFLTKRVTPDDLIVSPWRLDGHPDHDAAGNAAATAAGHTGADLVEYPVWMWHWARPAHALIPWGRARCVRLDDREREGKRAAIDQFVSQITPDLDRAAILPPHVMARFTRPHEIFFC